MPFNKAARIEHITIKETNKAEKKKESFKEEIAALKVASIIVKRAGAARPKKAQVNKSSTIFKLDQQMTDSLLRVGGRLKAKPVELDAMHLIILPAHTISV